MQEPLILVGFGKHDLKDLWANRHSEEGAKLLMDAIPVKHWPPRYRRISICSKEEVLAFQEYVNWAIIQINPKKEEEE